jgi:hypothetical protein
MGKRARRALEELEGSCHCFSFLFKILCHCSPSLLLIFANPIFPWQLPRDKTHNTSIESGAGHRNTPLETNRRTGPGPDFRPAADCTLARNGKTKDSPGPPQRALPRTRALTSRQEGAQLSQSNEGLPIELA